MSVDKTKYHRLKDLERLKARALAFPVIVGDTGAAYTVKYIRDALLDGPPLIAARYEVVYAFLDGWGAALAAPPTFDPAPAIEASWTGRLEAAHTEILDLRRAQAEARDAIDTMIGNSARMGAYIVELQTKVKQLSEAAQATDGDRSHPMEIALEAAKIRAQIAQLGQSDHEIATRRQMETWLARVEARVAPDVPPSPRVAALQRVEAALAARVARQSPPPAVVEAPAPPPVVDAPPAPPVQAGGRVVLARHRPTLPHGPVHAVARVTDEIVCRCGFKCAPSRLVVLPDETPVSCAMCERRGERTQG